MIDGRERQRILDHEHLRLLSLFYYISAGIGAFYACIPLVHVTIGLILVIISRSVPPGGGEAPPAFIGWLFILIGGTIVLVGWLYAAAKAYAGRCIRRRENRAFCLVVAGISCLGIPYGTALGIFTFIVLLRPSVGELFAAASSPAPVRAPRGGPHAG